MVEILGDLRGEDIGGDSEIVAILFGEKLG